MTAELLKNIETHVNKLVTALSDKKDLVNKAKERFSEGEGRALSIVDVEKEYSRFMTLAEHLSSKEFQAIEKIDDIVDQADTLGTTIAEKVRPKEFEQQIEDTLVPARVLQKLIRDTKE